MSDSLLRRSLPWWAASALIPVVLLAAFAIPASPARAAAPAPASPVEVECGDTTPMILVPGGTALDLAYFTGPNAGPDMDRYMVDLPAVQADVWEAFLAHVREHSDIGSKWVCRGCDIPGACVVWPVDVWPGIQYDLDWYQVGDVWVVEMIIPCDLTVSCICTEC